MLSYQHVYHAGNRADLLKHAVLCNVLNTLVKDKQPIFYVETHAARGLYDLSSKEAQKGAEYPEGIGQLWNLKRTPPLLAPHLDEVKKVNPGDKLQFYPGSPKIAGSILRKTDRMAFFELHPQEIAHLETNFKDDDRVQIRKADGYRGALSLAPRGKEQMVVLIDPSYETMDDLEALVDWVPRALRRWPNAIIMIWLPLFKDNREDEFGAYLADLAPGGISGARWPDDPDSRSALAGTAMISYRIPQKAVEDSAKIADICETLWAQQG
ncbi:23S rRNA (adenine(2030)-N(6))-methyltransferase RlmJ [Ponticaulis profundi]|uniref:Ribosomal RNA large subunit methyltransferase J n=1 Tax=Ponticaulis profundi TaxID=2665222 RepID=A0ABW1SDL8_9PROT